MRDCTIRVAKTKTLISFALTACTAKNKNQGPLEINHEILLTGDEIVENNPSYLTSAYIQ